MKSQKGQALILVLILLAVGSLTIAPVLKYTFSALRSQQVSEDAFNRLYNADSAVQDAIWQMLNDILSGGSPVTGNFTFELGSFSISAPTIPLNQDLRSPPVLHLQVEVVPNWVAANAGNVTYTYIIRIQHQKWDEMDRFGLTLPAGLTYVAGSTRQYGPEKDAGPTGLSWDAQVDIGNNTVKLNNGTLANMTSGYYTPYYGGSPSPPYVLITNGDRTLVWKRADTGMTGNKVLIQKFTAVGTPKWGIHTTTLQLIATSGSTWQDDAILGVAFYTIVVTVGGVKYEAIVAYDTTTGTFQIISYQPL